MSLINEFLQRNKEFTSYGDGLSYRNRAPLVVCQDGFEMSVQVSHTHYCTPRVDDAEFYDSVEIGYPSEDEPLILEFAEQPECPTDTVYGYVPVGVVDAVIEKHGGIVE